MVRTFVRSKLDSFILGISGGNIAKLYRGKA